MDISKLSIGNAAGTVRTLEQVKKLLPSAVTRIKVGTITRHRRQGNTPIPGGRIYFFDEGNYSTYNALGMPNVGIDEFATTLKEMVRLAHEAGKELWVSVAGETPEEFTELAAICFACGVDGVEYNGGCPNVHDKGVSKPIFSYRPDLVEEILDYATGQFYGQDLQISFKISPVDNKLLKQLVQVLNRCTVLTEVTATNTLPNQETLDEAGRSALAFIPPGGTEVMHKGGLGGKLLKPEVLRIVKELREPDPSAPRRLSPNTKLTVVGGIFTGEDLFDYLRTTPDIQGFECGSAYYEHEDPSIFTTIPIEYLRLLETESEPA